MDLGIEGKVALVTAASAGLGFGCAQALASEGCRVAINGHDAARLDAARRRSATRRCAPADVTDPDAPAALVASTVERFGGLDILVANAPGPPKARATGRHRRRAPRRRRGELPHVGAAGPRGRPAHARRPAGDGSSC
jgi:3-oxoacyl-[acyl-carrier protein] reductase